MLHVVEQGVLSHRPDRGAYMPSVALLPDGSFIAAQHVGSDLGAADNHIVILRSRDGRTWKEQGSIHGPAGPADGWAYRGPQIRSLGNGRLAMTASRFAGNGRLFNVDTEALKRPEMLLFWSADSGVTWSPPQVIATELPPERYTCNTAGHLLTPAPDRWLYPVETWKPEGWSGPPDQKAALLVSADQGRTWGDFTIVADDPTGHLLYWDQMNALLPDGRLYTLLWTHVYSTRDDLENHFVLSENQGRTWSSPEPTNLAGQVCAPIPLTDGRVAAVYNHRREPQGIRVAVSADLRSFDLDHQVVVFDAGAEATLGVPGSDNFLAEHLLIGFGKPGGMQLSDGQILVYFWCTAGGITHTRWARIQVEV